MRSGWGPQRRFSATYALSCALRAKSSENVWAEEPSGGRAGGQLLRPSQKSLEVVQFVSTNRSKFYPVRCICSSIICHRLFCEIQFVGYFWFSGTLSFCDFSIFSFFLKNFRGRANLFANRFQWDVPNWQRPNFVYYMIVLQAVSLSKILCRIDIKIWDFCAFWYDKKSLYCLIARFHNLTIHM